MIKTIHNFNNYSILKLMLVHEARAHIRKIKFFYVTKL